MQILEQELLKQYIIMWLPPAKFQDPFDSSTSHWQRNVSDIQDANFGISYAEP